MAGGIEPAGIDIVGVVHAQLGGAAVHLLYKHGLAAADILSHRHGGIVGAAHTDGPQHFVQRELLAGLQPDLAAAHAVAVLTHGHDILFVRLARLQCLKGEQQGHYLGDGCLGQLDIGVLGIQHRAALLLYEHGRLAGQVKFRLAKAAFGRQCGQRRAHRQHPCQQQRRRALA